MEILVNFRNVKQRVKDCCLSVGKEPKDVMIVCVSKRQPVEKMLELADALALAGVRPTFGENIAQELEQKAPQFKDKADFHFIGRLQSNKAKIAVRHCRLIESVHSEKLLKEINKLRQK